MTFTDFADAAAGRHALTGGSSTCPMTGLVPGVGYMVGIKGYEETVPADLSRDALAGVIERYMMRHASALVGRHSNPRFVGTWEHEGSIYLDVSEQIVSFDEAYRTAQERGERALYSVIDQREVSVSSLV